MVDMTIFPQIRANSKSLNKSTVTKIKKFFITLDT
ncbi:hypothetical protein QE382_004128 [Sphingobacterium zeae]|uniref:Uncharacterized protein n=1 Tax=Sphingobacterium zeae TaxID=1776859 RepID=A0ABU0UBE3_9SPHI|nr:hypothetical protein [Sphingobacterium zeae]